MKQSDHIDSVRLSDKECHQLLDSLDSRSPNSFKRRRAQARVEYRVQNVAVTVTHQGGRSNRFLVCARNLSVGGMAFLHGGFLYDGTPCSVMLNTLSGATVEVEGEVRSCRHVRGHIHEVGIQFKRVIDPAQFCRPGARTLESDSAAVSVRIPGLQGLVLIVSARATERRSLGERLSATGISCSSVGDVRAAAFELQNHPCPAVICDCSIKNFDATGAFSLWRGLPYDGPIIAIGGERHLVMAAGATAWVGRPLDLSELIAALDSTLNFGKRDRSVA